MKINNLKTSIVIIPTFTIIFILIIKGYLSIECPIYKIFHIYCPGCGITRALISLINFNLYQAFRYNPLVVIMLPFIIFYFVYKIYIYLSNKSDNITKKIPHSIYYFLLILIITYGIIRNIDIFNWLAPTQIS